MNDCLVPGSLAIAATTPAGEGGTCQDQWQFNPFMMDRSP